MMNSLRNVPPTTKGLVFLTTSLYGLGLLLRLLYGGPDADGHADAGDEDERSLSYHDMMLAIIPGSIFWRPWTIVTAGFFESSLISYFEQVWGSREYLKFIFIVSVASAVMTTLSMYFEYAATLNEDRIFNTQINGLLGIIAGFLVAFKQTVPEHTLTLFGLVSVRVKYVPSVLMASSLILAGLGIFHVGYYLIVSGSIVAWTYIRFYKVQDGIMGDRSEAFSLASFFPEILHPFIHPVSNSTFNLMVTLNLCPPLAKSSSGDLEMGGGGVGKPTLKPLPGSDVADAERRRAIALRALDMRLSTSNNQAATAAGGVSMAGAPGSNEGIMAPLMQEVVVTEKAEAPVMTIPSVTDD
ncbi:hypothetical protein HK101_007606 [Irineochytrium annulatum]|nr:hypothetical protein HK101_007606 [Irineochytrium annulatum]